MSTVGERLDYYRKNKGLTYKDISHSLGLTEGAIRNAIKRDVVKLSHINVISDNFDVSKDWLLTGSGEMSCTKDKKEVFDKENQAVLAQQIGVPVCDIDFTASDINVFNEGEVEIIGHLNLPELKGSERIIRARGNSMSGVIDDRDFIGLKRITDFSFFNYGSPYAIVTENYRLLKFIRKSENPENVILRSNNPEYDDIEIAKDKILELHLITAVLPFSKIKTFM